MRWLPMVTLLLGFTVNADPLTFAGGPQQVALIELYTSEGCSSCPPADRFLAALKDQPDLFQRFIPLAFHVDYWDYIGWQDRFARPAFSQRQRHYRQAGLARSIYTPGFFIGGQEWQGYFQHPARWRQQLGDHRPGELTAALDQDQLRVESDGKLPAGALLNSAWIGMGLSSVIKRGENRGRTLRHDFVVLSWQQDPIPTSKQQIALPAIPQRGQQQTGLVIWISAAGNPRPLQAAATLLPDPP